MSIEESGLGRWARLKKARKDRNAGRNEAGEHAQGNPPSTHRGKASPTAYPLEASGEYRPWLPPLTTDQRDTMPVAAGDGEPTAGGHGDSEDVLSAEEAVIAREMDLPDIDSLEKESDFSAFLQQGVPDRLRRLALRKLWASNPLFGFRDGLNDYDEDFRGLSDYVHNMLAMRRFTEPENEPEAVPDETIETAENQTAGQGEGQTEEPLEADSISDHKSGHAGTESHDDEAPVADDDSELG